MVIREAVNGNLLRFHWSGRVSEAVFEMNRPIIRILIAHDWAIVRAGIRQILWEEFGPLVLTQVSSDREGFDLGLGPWDLAFVGIDALHRQGLQFLAALKRAYPRQSVLAVSSRARISHFDNALKSLVQGAIATESTRDQLLTAARRVITGGGKGALAALPKTPALSKRELEVLRLVAAGKNIKEVAATLNVSPSSISTYRLRILRKLQLGSTGELIRYAFRKNLAD